MQTDSPNVVVLIWDACRQDYAGTHAPTLADLASDNLTFKNAMAPAIWSLPSHASLVSGEYPSDHGSTLMTDQIDASPLVDSLHDNGYTCYSVSANGFASQRTGFHEAFDEVYYTGGEEPFLDGLGVYHHFRTERLHDDPGRFKRFTSALTAAATHDHPLQSFANLSAVTAGRAASKVDALQRLPHPIFSDDMGYNFSPEQHTSKIEDILAEEARTDEPFFLFSNYMNTHHPYNPPADIQKEVVGDALPLDELERINRDVAPPWDFIERVETDGVYEQDIERVRDLYAAEVTTVDAYMDRLLETLEREGLREETVVIVTSDHGENLGEVDAMGWQRIGHEASMSEALLRVPLVIAHPDLESREVDDLVSLKDIFGAITTIAAEGVRTDAVLNALHSDDVVCEYPAVGGDQLYEKYPGIPEAVIDYRVSENAVAAYSNEWKVVMDSTGAELAWHSGTERDIGEAPSALRERGKSHLQSLSKGQSRAEPSDLDVEQLEALGYL